VPWRASRSCGIAAGSAARITARRTRPIAARRKFERGPAAETTKFARRGFFVLRRSTGVGFADPKMRPEKTYRMIGTRIDPIGSMCRRGLRLIRPRSRAVVSPNFKADQAWADSWKEMAKRTMASWIAKSTILCSKADG
jgi:hypothetical protein